MPRPIFAGMLGVCAWLSAATGTRAAVVPIPLVPPSGSNAQITYFDGNTDKGLYGNPTLSGNTISFAPQNFIATSSNGVPQTTTDRLGLKVASTSGGDLGRITVHEVGDWSILGAVASVKVTGLLALTDLGAGPNFGTIYYVTPTVVYTDVENNLTLVSPQRPTTDGSGPFVVDYVYQLPAGVSAVQFTLNNNLQATSTAGTTSTIQKKAITIRFMDPGVPEPASLAAAGVGVVLLVRRRRA